MDGDQGIRAVVFDLDGLMFNTEELYEEVGSQILKRRGKAFSQDLLDQMMGRPSQSALQIMIDWHQLDASVADLVAETDALFPAVLDARLRPMNGLMELLDSLETHNIPKAIATSSRRTFVDNVLPRYDLQDRFAFTLTSEDVRQGKPHPEVYLLACRRIGHAPGQVMVLEDSEIGSRAAVAAGAVTVAVPGEPSRAHDFSEVQLLAHSLADPRIYERLGIPLNDRLTR